MKSETDFELWIGWSWYFMQFKIILAIEFFLTNIMVLLVLSKRLPSLAIMFETIERARFDIFYFSTTVLMALFITSTGFQVVFGANELLFSTFLDSFCTNYRQLLGDFQYEKMYNANPACAAVCFVFFVFFFCFLCINMYTAIIIRHYNNLQMKNRLF